MEVPENPKWQLYRQDDHGNQFLIDTFTSEAAALDYKRHLERYIHKQFYWISEISAATQTESESAESNAPA